MLGNLIGGFIAIVVGVSLIPAIADEVFVARYGGNGSGSNVTGAASTILNLSTLFFALGIMSIGVMISAQGLRAAGMFGV